MRLEIENCPFQVVGFYEDFVSVEFNQLVGSRRIADPGSRKFGAAGVEELTLTEPVELFKSLKTFMVKASMKRPLQVRTYLQMLCGPLKQPVI